MTPANPSGPTPQLRPDPKPLRWLPAALVLLAPLFLSPPSSAAGYAEGTPIVVTGTVTDTEGRPVPDLEVRFVARRWAFNMRRMTREARGETFVAARTNIDGAYEITWRWHDFYNQFDVAAGLQVREAGSSRWFELNRIDVTDWIADGSPVDVPISVEDSETVRSYRAFLASVRSADQRELYSQMGRPARIDRLEMDEHVEETWWYFQAGKGYRFEDGALRQVVDFEPVRSF